MYGRAITKEKEIKERSKEILHHFAKSYVFQKEYIITLLRTNKNTILILIVGDDILDIINSECWSFEFVAHQLVIAPPNLQ